MVPCPPRFQREYKKGKTLLVLGPLGDLLAGRDCPIVRRRSHNQLSWARGESGQAARDLCCSETGIAYSVVVGRFPIQP